jgi:hypothetical protein
MHTELGMKVLVNDKEIDLPPGMTVRHVLIAADFLKNITSGKKIFDEWGNEIGLDGAIEEGLKIYIR